MWKDALENLTLIIHIEEKRDGMKNRLTYLEGFRTSMSQQGNRVIVNKQTFLIGICG